MLKSFALTEIFITLMFKERKEVYFNLIVELLNCHIDERSAILNERPDLKDAGLVNMMRQLAAVLAWSRDYQEYQDADYLRNVAIELTNALGLLSDNVGATPEEYLHFLMSLLQKTQDSQANFLEVELLLDEGLDKLDDFLGDMLHIWACCNLHNFQIEDRISVAIAIGDLSNIIRDFPRGNRACNLELAITGYALADSVFTQQQFPEYWATNKINLGIAYFYRKKGDLIQNLDMAIASYNEALQVRTRDKFPEEWAKLHINLGNAYLYYYIRESNVETLKVAINFLSDALQVYTRNCHPEEWMITQNNLGTVYLKMEDIEKAIAAFNASLEISSPHKFSQDWAGAKVNLGLAYHKQGRIAEAIAVFEESLEVYTKWQLPHNWAMVQHNMGRTYRELNQIDNAIECFYSALQIYTPTKFPEECLITGRNLGDIAFETRQWETAIEGYAVRASASQTLLTSGLS
jgi:tetratricopeptide (TPR) repeat protein